MKTPHITLSGSLGPSESYTLRNQLQSCLSHSSHVLLDLSAVEFMDAVALGVLISAHRQAEKSNKIIELTGCNSHVTELLRLTRMNRILLSS